MAVFLRLWSTIPPKKIAPTILRMEKIPAMIEVIRTDLVSKNTQKVRANQTKLLVVLASRLLISNWRKVFLGEKLVMGISIVQSGPKI